MTERTAAALPIDRTVAVVGAGTMGAGIAQVAAQAGHAVVLFDQRPGAADRAIADVGRTLGTLVEKGRLDAEAARATAARLRAVGALSEVSAATLVIEAIVEDVGAKRTLFAELERIVAPHAILATNTSSLSVNALATGLVSPGRFVGMHFFNPVPLMALVEVVAGLATDPAVADAVEATARAWGKSPVRARSTPGFVVNRIARPFYAEALRLLHERAAAPATLDAVMREAGGFRMGPCELMDLVGHDVNLAVTKSVWTAFFHDPRFAPSLVQQEMVDCGRLGRKSGRGFYEHGPHATPVAPATAASGVRPSSIVAAGEIGPLQALLPRIEDAGIAVRPGPADARIGRGYLLAGSAVVALTDGRTATERAATSGHPNLILVDLALDYAAAVRVGLARAAHCGEAAWAEAVGLFQAAGLAVSPLDDVAGLAVMRTVAMLANEAADAVLQGVATPEDVDVAMRKGVNYPLGPLAWADRLGAAALIEVIRNLGQHYGEDRYRVSPLLARKAFAKELFHDA